MTRRRVSLLCGGSLFCAVRPAEAAPASSARGPLSPAVPAVRLSGPRPVSGQAPGRGAVFPGPARIKTKMTAPDGVVIFMKVEPPFGRRNPKPKDILSDVLLFWRCHPDLNWGVELLQSSALPLGYGTEWSKAAPKNGASDEARTRYLHLGKVALYQMSYTRMLPGRGCPSRALFGWCLRSESNQRHEDFQSSALPTELQRQIFLFERLQAGKPI